MCVVMCCRTARLANFVYHIGGAGMIRGSFCGIDVSVVGGV